MFIRVVSYEVKPGMMDEAEKLYHKFAKEGLRTQPGFQNGYAVINSHTGIAFTVAVWASKEDFEHFSATGAGKELADQVAPLLANPPTVTEFDRLIQA